MVTNGFLFVLMSKNNILLCLYPFCYILIIISSSHYTTGLAGLPLKETAKIISKSKAFEKISKEIFRKIFCMIFGSPANYD